MNRIISVFIFLFVAVYVLTIGFVILKASITNPLSNVALAGRLLHSAAPAFTFAMDFGPRLSDATSVTIQPMAFKTLSVANIHRVTRRAVSPKVPIASPVLPAEPKRILISTKTIENMQEALQALSATLDQAEVTSTTP